MRTRTVRIELGDRGYPILIGEGLLGQIAPIIEQLRGGRTVIVSNETVGPLYAGILTDRLRNANIEVIRVDLPDGEQYKDWHSLQTIFDVLLQNHCERHTTLIAVGGGVVGDIAGFAAACYQRGMPFVQVPTTLLAQVDSSVGGKTAINHPLGKNMIGAFYQPRLVLADISVLATLPPRELSAGLAEVIKYGLIRDPEFFRWLEANLPRIRNREPEPLAEAIERSCRHKAEIVAADERESGVRALLNLGHTFGHAIETGMGYGQWLHGEAVAAGTMIAADLSHRSGWISGQDLARIERAFEAAGLPTSGPTLSPEQYFALMQHDKKVASGRIQYVLLRAIGDAFVTADVDRALVGQAILARTARANG
jgi:3-dehydroquinate synthase